MGLETVIFKSEEKSQVLPASVLKAGIPLQLSAGEEAVFWVKYR